MAKVGVRCPFCAQTVPSEETQLWQSRHQRTLASSENTAQFFAWSHIILSVFSRLTFLVELIL